MSSIPTDQWYVAAYGREIGQELFSRTICGEPIVFCRTGAGAVTAMSDRCVHRRFPLSEAPSRLDGDQVVCGYHGFTYDADGACVAVPGQNRVPRTARLSRYPVVEQDSFVWVWIGDPAMADPAADPAGAVAGLARLHHRVAAWSRSTPATVCSWTTCSTCRTRRTCTAATSAPRRSPRPRSPPRSTRRRASSTSAGTWTTPNARRSTPSPPASTAASRAGRTSSTRPPCLYKLHSRIAPVGVLPSADGSDPDAFHVEVVYAITPETEHTTHDFWAVARDFALDDEGVSEFLAGQQPHRRPAGRRRAQRAGAGDRERARGLPGAVHQHRHRRAGRPADARQAGRAERGTGRGRPDERRTHPHAHRPRGLRIVLAAGHRPAARHLPLRREHTSRKAPSRCGSGCSPTRSDTTSPPWTARRSCRRARR